MLEVSRLSAEQSVAMTRHCLGDSWIPAEVLQLVVDRADGLPFFVEELLAALEYDGALPRQVDQWVAERPVVRVPATFAESVRHRFGSLADSARELLLDAALLGRRIDPDVVAGVEPGAVTTELCEAEQRLLLEVHDSGFRFRHALTRDALLADLPQRSRVARAGMVLDRLTRSFPEAVSGRPEVVADLAEIAERYDEAAEPRPPPRRAPLQLTSRTCRYRAVAATSVG